MVVIANTMIESFYDLISESQKVVGIELDVEIEAFVVYALLRNVKYTKLKEMTFAQSLLNGISHKNIDELEKVLDCSLIYAGWYPKRAQKLGVSPSYFSDIGKTASLELAYYYRLLKSSYQKTYTKISMEFDKLVMLLQSFLTAQEIQRTFMK
ncbi:hypothetical protein [Cysteiniphilum halobium]|uniref:hypothetical protein n=1 Tax=Cysteiniphilum halobium TaxID=2219059 RepID=UPI000E654DC5|nr:hypothetical protein [Cysteiniphilum halobium]